MKAIEIGLAEIDLNKIIKVFKNNTKISSVVIFGSRAKGNYNAGSDIDLALKGNTIELNDILDLTNDLDNLDLPYKFDLVIFEKIKEKAIKDHIERVGKNLF